jgi:hypothetical protein
MVPAGGHGVHGLLHGFFHGGWWMVDWEAIYDSGFLMGRGR